MAVGTGATELDEVKVGRGMSKLLVLKIASTGSIILKVHLTKDETVVRMMDVMRVDVEVDDEGGRENRQKSTGTKYEAKLSSLT